MTSDSGLKSLFGDELQNKEGVKIPVDEIKGRNIGIYFSAHWCPPCRAFTPKLVEWYDRAKATENLKDIFEFIFVSSDRDEKAFNEYFGEMHWLALPFSNRDKKNELATKFNIRGIPALIIVDSETMKVHMQDGRQQVMKNDPENFNWIK